MSEAEAGDDCMGTGNYLLNTAGQLHHELTVVVTHISLTEIKPCVERGTGHEVPLLAEELFAVYSFGKRI